VLGVAGDESEMADVLVQDGQGKLDARRQALEERLAGVLLGFEVVEGEAGSVTRRCLWRDGPMFIPSLSLLVPLAYPSGTLLQALFCPCGCRSPSQDVRSTRPWLVIIQPLPSQPLSCGHPAYVPSHK